MRTLRVLIPVVGLLAAAASIAEAQNKGLVPPVRTPYPIPKVRIAISNLLVGRVNPLGLEDQLRVGVLKRLFVDSAMAMRDNYAGVSLAPRLSPAYVKVGPSFELQPLSMLNLRFTAEVMQWFGTFNTLQSFGSPLDDYSDTTMRANNGAGLSYRPHGVHIFLEPTVQLRVGPVAFRNRLSIEWFHMALRPGDRTFYDISLDTMVENGGFVIANDMDLLYLHRFNRWPTTQLAVGARYSVVQPLYSKEAYRPGEDPNVNPNGQHRLGPILALTFFDRGYIHFNKPTLLIIVNWYVQHRWRTGADVSAGAPYAVIGFAFTSDFIPR